MNDDIIKLECNVVTYTGWIVLMLRLVPNHMSSVFAAFSWSSLDRNQSQTATRQRSMVARCDGIVTATSCHRRSSVKGFL